MAPIILTMPFRNTYPKPTTAPGRVRQVEIDEKAVQATLYAFIEDKETDIAQLMMPTD